MEYLRVQPLAPSIEAPIPAPLSSTTYPTPDPPTPVDLHAPACRRLINRAFSEDEVIPLLETIFTSQDEVKMIGYLCGDDAQAFIDAIDAVRPHSPSFPSRGLITSILFGSFVSEFPPPLIRLWTSLTSHHSSRRSA